MTQLTALSLVAWTGLLSGALVLGGTMLRMPPMIWLGMASIGAGFVAMCWLGALALNDLRPDPSDAERPEK